ncbi:MAG TPA: sigma-70 family RNA polymerase sigma factor, partial [Myxococcota bacterium]|nr:sigma-70 family RNA polymerase sigma factor [Myxococcota bacterium]
MERAKMNGAGPAGEATDEELMRALAGGREEALQPLYARYAPAVFGLAAHSLERTTAEEIVQDVFLTVWRNAQQYDPARGSLRPWLLQIAHFRVLNELRRRSRRPQLAPDRDRDQLDALADPDPGPSAAAWSEYRRGAVRSALELLPPAQRQALGLAFFDELTHEQVAEVLQLRLGTAKTRIRAGLAKLREQLAPLLVSLVLLLTAGIAALLHHRGAEEGALAIDERALDLVTSSDVVPLRLEPAAGVGGEVHASYRSRPGTPIAVLSLSKLPPTNRDRVYQAWLRYRGSWLSLGTASPDAEGRARIVAEGPAVAAPAEALEVTLEPSGGSAA